MNETFEQFCDRMSKVEKKEEFVVGRAYQGNSRAIFDFEGQCCWLESFGYRTLPKDQMTTYTPAQMMWAISGTPSDQWIHSHLFYTKDRAKRMMKEYRAKRFDEDPYPREEGVWFFLVFAEFEDLMRLVWDIHTGAFKEKWGDEAKEYESCIGYLEDAR